jgi:hypothetical protein
MAAETLGCGISMPLIFRGMLLFELMRIPAVTDSYLRRILTGTGLGFMICRFDCNFLRG